MSYEHISGVVDAYWIADHDASLGAQRPASPSREAPSMTIARYAIAVVLILVGLVWMGQGLGVLGGSSMSGQSIFAVIGIALVVVGAAIALLTRRSSAA